MPWKIDKNLFFSLQKCKLCGRRCALYYNQVQRKSGLEIIKFKLGGIHHGIQTQPQIYGQRCCHLGLVNCWCGSVNAASKTPTVPAKIESIAQKAANQAMAKYDVKPTAKFAKETETPLADGTLYHVSFTSKDWVKGTKVTVTVNSQGKVTNLKSVLPAD